MPDEVDWNKKGGVSPVDNMLLCEANWALAAVGTIEGASFAKTGKYVQLSAQQCIDCDVSMGENWDNCDGGWADDCIAYGVMRNISPAKDFPFQHRQMSCTEETETGPIGVK